MSAAPSIEAHAADLAAVMLDLPSFGGLVEIRTKGDRERRIPARKIAFDYACWHPEQQKFERERTGRDLILKPRQIGFSTLEIARDVQFARTNEGVQVVVVVHNGEAKTELFAAVHLMVRCLERLGLVPKAKENTKNGLRWTDNDSSIKVIEAGKDEATAADRGRSGTIHRLHVTEAAFYKSPEETLTALFAAADQGEIVIESTASGVGNWFHEHVMLARDGRFDDFVFHFFPWYEHPQYRERAGSRPAPTTKREQFWEKKLRALGCDDEQIAWWRKQVAAHKLDKALREYPPTIDAAFTVSTTKWFAPEHIDRLRGSVREPLDRRALKRGEAEYGDLRIYAQPISGTAYILAADPSGGMGNNAAAITVIEHRSGEPVACWDNNRVKPGEFGHVIAMVGRLYNNALAAPERNEWRDRDGNDKEGGLETIDVLMRVEDYRRVYHTGEGKTKKYGWSMNEHTRPLVFGDLQKGIEDADEPLTTPDARTVDEAASLVLAPKTNRPYVPGKKHGRGDDGLFITWGIARQVRARAPMPGRVIAKNVGAPLASSGFRT